MKIDLTTGRLLWNVPAGALCMGISVKNGRILVSDLPTGKVLLLPQDDPWPRRILWQGSAPQACFL
jgi:outer membrane protein assembly factor BamB